ncbi:MAG: TetR/AcrR family transcriptional regulator [Spirochaetales bacterium]|nr:TetR/AcrR family transcriptional regulator [Spirochaetales bacterium]
MGLSPLKQKRRSAIIKATRKIFLTKGFIEATMLDISDELGISRRTLYSYFRTKEDLSFEIIYDAFHSLYQALSSSSKTDEKTAVESLLTLKDVYLDQYENNFESFVFTLYFDLKLTSKTLSNPIAIDIVKEIEKIHKLIVSFVKRGMQDGSIRNDLDPNQAVSTFLILIHSFLQKMAINETVLNQIMRYDSEIVLNNLFQMVFSYIQGK